MWLTDFEKCPLFLRAIFIFSCSSDTDHDKIFDEFAEYQLLNGADIPETVWASAREKMYKGDGSTPTDEVFLRMDVILAFLSSMRTPDHYSLMFPKLSQVAKLVLVYHTFKRFTGMCI